MTDYTKLAKELRSFSPILADHLLACDRERQEAGRVVAMLKATENTRVTKAEALAQRYRDALIQLNAWASRMPDAGFTSDDPRWAWWHQRPRVGAALTAGDSE